ncbi:MAG: hypothetical protein ACI4HQ_12600 [Acetatifactor sp.]
MEKVLYVAFRGINNSSYQLVRQMNAETFYITNSFTGVRRDIDSLPMSYEKIIMFGLDKDLHETIRFDRIAQKNGDQLFTLMDLTPYLYRAKQHDVPYTISETPTTYLCNEAYFYMMRKMKCPVLFIHIPSMPHMSNDFLERLKKIFEG